jgi:putative two-component system response regulator
MDRVLIVDGDPGIRGLMARWAESLGWWVRAAATADEALAELARTRFDVAVAPATTSGRDGLWLAGRLRDAHVETAVVLTASTGEVDPAVEALRAGVADYLLQPFERERFRDAILRGREWTRATSDSERRRRSIALELAARRRQLASAVANLDLGTIDALRAVVAILTLRDRSTLDHSIRVAALAADLASVLGLSPSERDDLDRAALLHELPRAVVPETVLWKTGELTAEEWQLLRSQPEFAHELFRSRPGLAGAADILRALREHFDGTGYPAGLSGESIPIGARVLAAADAYDTMTHPQTHRDPLSPAEVRAELLRGRGTQFDPRAADSLLGRIRPQTDSTTGLPSG